jgi:glycosyltransferase involved in cell wall biosynthesis
MSTDPMITSVIPTYRRPELLRRAIRSILDQNYHHFKICVYDNASNDRTPAVVRELASQDPRVHYHCNPENIGAPDNFALGLSEADTPFVHLISDDDFLLPNFFNHAVAAMQENPDAAFFSGGMLSTEPDGRVRGFLCYGTETKTVCHPPALFKLLAPYTRTWTSALFRRASLNALGGLKKETGYGFSIELILRSSTRFQAILSDTPCAVFTVHPGSSSVAEASEAFESLLNLAFFDSLTLAIDLALKDKIITNLDAAEMKEILRKVVERNLFQGAFGVLARRGNLRTALKASELLSQHFNRRYMAAAISTAALDNTFGVVLRLALRNVKRARRLWVERKRTKLYSGYSQIVRARLSELNI